jgi:uncharacterized protein DUF4339
MAAEWYYAEDGRAIGPVSAQEIVDRIIKAQHQPLFVWTVGMSEWTDARALQQFSAGFQTDAAERPGRAGGNVRRSTTSEHSSLKQRARHELIAYLGVSGYLLVWFSAVLFYKATILGKLGIEFAPFGLAAVKALILGKFILVLEALRIGERRQGDGILAIEIVKEALLFTLLLIALSILEEVIVGYFHGREASQILAGLGGGTIPQAVAMSALMFLVLLPYLAFRRLALTLGELPELLFARRSFEKQG